MGLNLNIDSSLQIPIYKQIVTNVLDGINNGTLPVGTQLPSMTELSVSHNIAKETVKKAYDYLRKEMIIDSVRGKGCYIADTGAKRKKKILLLFDKISTYKQILYDSFQQSIHANAEITLYLHNQNIDLFAEQVASSLPYYDYFIITPHFPLEDETQKRLIKILNKIPNYKLILLDRKIDELPGNYGAVYQDFRTDVVLGLREELKSVRHFEKLCAIHGASSMYARSMKPAIQEFAQRYNINVEFHDQIPIDIIHKGYLYLVRCGQHDDTLIQLIELAQQYKYKIGKDIGIISYNDSPINKIILNGLSCVSTDFVQMGQLAAEMINTKVFRKVHCDFKLIRRNTF